MRAAAVLLLIALAPGLGACARSARESSEAAWQRGQCSEIIDEKLREKCMERVDRDYGR